MTTFGMAAIEKQKAGAKLAELPDPQMLFGVFDQFPLSLLMSIIAMMLIGTFFITSADSATFVLGMQTTYGSLEPAKRVKFAWGIAQSAIAAVLLYTGGLQALQNALISATFPFSIIMVLMVYSLYKALRKDKMELEVSKEE